MSTSDNVNSSYASFSDENTSDDTETLAPNAPPLKNIFGGIKGIPRRTRSNSSVTDQSSGSTVNAASSSDHSESSEASTVDDEDEVKSETSQDLGDMAITEAPVNMPALPIAHHQGIVESSDEQIVTPPSPTDVPRESENLEMEEESKSDSGHASSDEEIVIPPSPTDVSRDAENLGIEEELKSEAGQNLGKIAADASTNMPLIETLVFEPSDEKIVTPSPLTDVFKEAENAEIAEELKSETRQNLENIAVTDASIALSAMDQDVEFSDEEIVTPPSPTVVSREAENLGITGSTDDEVEGESKVEEKGNNDANISNASISNRAVDSENNAETVAENRTATTDISENLAKFIESVFRITPEDSHKFILHNMMSLAFFIKTQISATTGLEQAQGLVKEIDCLLKRL